MFLNLKIMHEYIPFVKKHLSACIILAASLVSDRLVYSDYGLAWDESLQHDIGLRTYNYVFRGDTTLNGFKNRDYGVAVELPLISP